MMNRGVFHIILIHLAVLCSCSKKIDTEEYINWVRSYDNGLHVKKEVNEYIFDALYQPSYYLKVLREQNEQQPYSEMEDTTTVDDLQYYVLTIGLKDNSTDFIDYGVSDRTEKQQKLYYYSYTFQQDIQLEENNQILPCLLFHFERQMDLRPTRTFVLGFAKTLPIPTSSRLIINSPLISSVPVKVKISKENIPNPKSYETSL